MVRTVETCSTRENSYDSGRDGASRSSDRRLDINLTSPGKQGDGTNPEQLFAAGWSAWLPECDRGCGRQDEDPSAGAAAIDAEVDLCGGGGEWFLRARLNVSLPGLERNVAQAIVDAAHQTCPYSKATRETSTSRSAWREGHDHEHLYS